MNNVIALINLHNTTELGELTKNRPIASTTFLGRYAFVDFILSNLTNSGIDQFGILIKDHSRSIIKHLGGSNTFLHNTKTGFLSFFLNEKGLTNQTFNTDINNILQNDWFMYDTNVKYIIVCPCQYLLNLDYSEFIQEHIKSNRQVSMLVSDIKNADDEQYLNASKVVVDALGDVQKFETNHGKTKEATINLETYVFNIDFFREVLNKAPKISEMFQINDLLEYLGGYIEKINAVRYKGFVRRIASLNSYYKISMEFLKNSTKTLDTLFKEDWPIFTLTHNSRPVLYGENAKVSSSLIANGCKINGTVKNSILSRNVIIEEGAVVEDCIIFTDTKVSKGIHLKNCVIDKHCRFKVKEKIEGDKNAPIYIPQGAQI